MITLSEYWRTVVSDEFRLTDKVIVIYNPCVVQTQNETIGNVFADSDITMSQKHSILYAGTVNARKGYADLIRAFAKIAVQHEEWMLVFAGNGETERGKKIS